MRGAMPCPSDLALEQYLLGELPPSQSHVGDHVATCATCRTKLADKDADSAAFASSPGAAAIKAALAPPAPMLPASAPPAVARDAPRRRIVAALVFAAAIALAFVVALRPPASVTASRASDADEKEAVMRVQREWMEAIRDKNAAALDRILADDYTYTDSSGTVSNKADSLRQARTSRGRMTTYQTSDEKAQIYGDLAVVTGRLRVEGVAGSGQTYDAEVRFTDILARIDGQWRAVAAHASKSSER